MQKRLAEPQDINAVYNIYMHPNVVPFLGYDPMPLEEFSAIYDALVKSRSFYLYESNGEIAAFVRVSRYDGRVRHVACLGTLAVSPSFQSTGIAKTITIELLEELKKDGVKRIVNAKVKKDDFMTNLGYIILRTSKNEIKLVNPKNILGIEIDKA